MTLDSTTNSARFNNSVTGKEFSGFDMNPGGTLKIGVLPAPVNRIFVNVEECPAFDTAFRVGAADHLLIGHSILKPLTSSTQSMTNRESSQTVTKVLLL